MVKWKSYGMLDSAIIEKDSSRTIYITDHGLEACQRGPFFSDVSNDIKSLSITKGTKTSRLDYLKNDNWAYDKGAYTATVTSSEF
jgi:hypothetical protein